MKTRAPAAIKAVVAHVLASEPMLALLGGKHLYRAGANRDHHVPAVEWLRISAPLRENTQRVLLQFDVYGRTYDEASRIEALLTELLHHDNPVAIGGLWMAARYDDSRDHPDDSGDNEVRQSVDFAFELVKEH